MEKPNDTPVRHGTRAGARARPQRPPAAIDIPAPRATPARQPRWPYPPAGLSASTSALSAFPR